MGLDVGRGTGLEKHSRDHYMWMVTEPREHRDTQEEASRKKDLNTES